MAISFVNKSAFASGTGALTVGAVASTQNNDLILLFVESENQAVTTPTGYTIVTSSPVSTGTAATAGAVRLSVFYKFATGADTTTTVADSGDHTTAIKIAYRGVDTTTPFDATPVSGIKTPASTTATFPSITTATANALVVLASALDLDLASTATTGAATNANLTTITERHDQTVIAGDGGGLVIIDGVKATAGSTGTTTATVTSTIQVYLTIALREAALPAITGSLSVTETGADTFSATGDVIVEGSLTVTETGVDTFSASGTVADQTSTGSLAAAETGNDTFTGTGDVIVEGSLAATETGTDSFSGTGDVIVSGSLTATETETDTFASTGKIVVSGSFASTETGTDTFVGTGTVLSAVVSGSLIVSETGSDTFASSGHIIVTGSLSATEASDSLAASGTVRIIGIGSLVETGLDTFTANGATTNNAYGTMSATEAADSLGSYTTDGYVDSGYTLSGWQGFVYYEYPLPSTVLEGVRYGPNGMYVGTATGGGTGTRIEIVSGKIVKLVGETGALLIN